MTWLAELLKKTKGIPKDIQNLISRKSNVPPGLWHSCKNCETQILADKFAKNLEVCEHCNYHHPVKINDRIAQIFDPHFIEISQVPPKRVDPLNFVDSKPYLKRLAEAREKCNSEDAFKIIEGQIFGQPVVSFIMNFEFIGGSMGIAVGNGIVQAANLALQKQIPLLFITASGGARMQEGLFSLMQMPRSVIAVNRVKQAGLPYIALLLSPTTGGVEASFAMLGTITMSEPNTLIGFTGPRVIKDTLGIKLPPGFQSAEFLLAKGFLDKISPRAHLKADLARALRLSWNKSHIVSRNNKQLVSETNENPSNVIAYGNQEPAPEPNSSQNLS